MIKSELMYWFCMATSAPAMAQVAALMTKARVFAPRTDIAAEAGAGSGELHCPEGAPLSPRQHRAQDQMGQRRQEDDKPDPIAGCSAVPSERHCGAAMP